ncbi:hypothetical protein [Nonomuraea sp. NEAU-A123]|uniref:hypothetical protein n=1 Tax=Nonomuraea sp. NEAU-A123 TaxID=2839649 RepID=UPI002032D568|nr:hypothetical protein [Nonomuraea sp. NEAU-A123]
MLKLGFLPLRPYDDPIRQADPKPYWNTNVARHPGILRAVPGGAAMRWTSAAGTACSRGS